MGTLQETSKIKHIASLQAKKEKASRRWQKTMTSRRGRKHLNDVFKYAKRIFIVEGENWKEHFGYVWIEL